MATFSDTFTRADTTWGLGADWTVWAEDAKILSNAVAGYYNGDGGASCNKVATADHYAQVEWHGSHGYYQIMCRGNVANAYYYGQTGFNCYHVEVNSIGSSSGTLYRAVNGVWTSLGSASDVGYTSGQTAYIEAVGSTVTYKRNGTTVRSATDTNITSGTWTGFKCGWNNTNTTGFDNWTCADISSGTNANAEAATATGAANDATATVATPAGEATATGAANDAAPRVAPAAGSAAATGTANGATATTASGTSPVAEAATATATAHDAGCSVAASAECATGSATALPAVVSSVWLGRVSARRPARPSVGSARPARPSITSARPF